MSTQQQWSLDLGALQAQRAMEALERRRLELTRLRTERSAAIHREVLSIAREHERLTRSQFARQAGALSQAEADLTRLGERARVAGVRLDAMGEQLQASLRELDKARTELQSQVSRLQALEGTAERLEGELRADLAAASGVLAQVTWTAEATLETADTLGAATTTGRRLSEIQGELDGRIRALESEIQFVTQRADLAPVAMVTLQAMEENGYRLQDTISREGLILYFQKEGAAHHLAVRMAPDLRQGEGTARWDLLAETFDLKDASCLDEMEDFETALESRGTLRRRGGRVYPRDDRQAVVPPPPRRRTAGAAGERAGDRVKA
jgi:hypothetical protein